MTPKEENQMVGRLRFIYGWAGTRYGIDDPEKVKLLRGDISDVLALSLPVCWEEKVCECGDDGVVGSDCDEEGYSFVTRSEYYAMPKEWRKGIDVFKYCNDCGGKISIKE